MDTMPARTISLLVNRVIVLICSTLMKVGNILWRGLQRMAACGIHPPTPYRRAVPRLETNISGGEATPWNEEGAINVAAE